MRKLLKLKTLAAAVLILGFSSCDDDENVPNLRTSIDYSLITATTPYSSLFLDANGATTVDLTEGHHRYKMFQALNYQSTSAIAANTQVEADKLSDMFSNTNDPFTDIATSSISVTGSELNESGVQLKNVVASSLTAADAEAVREEIESLFGEIELASASVGQVAAQGQAGKLGNYLVDAKGIEVAQVIQKSLIGALQLDYIGNVLLDEGLDADNHNVVSDKNYTELEHNWDVAYGLLTLNEVYLLGATTEARNSQEFGAGAYIWEYNRTNFSKVYPAFLKGRAAIVNNDKAELQAQATIIRTQFEKALAGAAIGYLDKWKNETGTGTDADAKRAHAISEGIGFIYSLRFAEIHGVDASFSDDLINDLVGSENGFWDLTAAKINEASATIKAKFSL